MTTPLAEEIVLTSETGLGRFQVEAFVGSASFFVDEPVALGGLGTGPNPYDLLAVALASCTTMTLRLFAARKGWPLDRVSVRVGHKRATLAARDRFERELYLEGDLDDEQRARLIEIAGRCPVHLTLERGADVITTIGPVSSVTELEGRHSLHVDHMDESGEPAILVAHYGGHNAADGFPRPWSPSFEPE